MIIIEGSSDETKRLGELATKFAEDIGKEQNVILTSARIIGAMHTNDLLDGKNSDMKGD